ncbi:MAG TPA: hypothetical protein VI837_02815, partial [Blastocatellia bacterium]|nr:hypothetical protein [Blastocatellia bacterium]
MQKGGSQAAAPGKGGGQGAQTRLVPISSRAVGFAESRPLRDIIPTVRVSRQDLIDKGVPVKDIDDVGINPKNEKRVKTVINSKDGASSDPVMTPGKIEEPKIPAPIVNFEGVNGDGNIPIFGGRILPPDTNAAVGPSHVVETVNTLFRVFDKSGTPLTAVLTLGSIWASIAGACANANDGDPIVLYDWQADRWLISQFCTVANPNNHQLIAISKTGDPTGAYWLYDFMMPNNKFNDYPKFGVWPDAYYMTDNQFAPFFDGAGVFAFDRSKMLVG